MLRNLNANEYINIINNATFLTAADCGGNEKQPVPRRCQTGASVIKHTECNCTFLNFYKDRRHEGKEDGSKQVPRIIF